MKHDSTEWRALRNEMLQQWIQNDHAVAWLLDLSEVCEVFDDLADRDKPVGTARLNNALWLALVEAPGNPFFHVHRATLLPVMIAGINAWQDANIMEFEKRSDSELAMSYVLRDWYMELVSVIMYLTRGREAMRAESVNVRRFFTQHESLDRYKAKLLESPED